MRLRQMFDEVVNEEVPDEFLDILRRADDVLGEGLMAADDRSARPRNAADDERVQARTCRS